MNDSTPITIRPRTRIITCPSGLVVTLRKYKVREENGLANEHKARAGTGLEDLLGACTLEVHDWGPYQNLKGYKPAKGQPAVVGPFPWRKAIQGDRSYAMMLLRITTHGGAYEFDETCDNVTCKKPIPWEVNLEDRPVQMLSPADRKILEEGNRFKLEVPAGCVEGFDDRPCVVWYELATGETEAVMSKKKAKYKERLSMFVLLLRIVEVEGVGKRPSTKLEDFLDNLDSDVADFIRADMETHNCGVETTIRIQCQHCDTVKQVEVPFDSAFFSPQLAKKQRVVEDLDDLEDLDEMETVDPEAEVVPRTTAQEDHQAELETQDPGSSS